MGLAPRDCALLVAADSGAWTRALAEEAAGIVDAAEAHGITSLLAESCPAHADAPLAALLRERARRAAAADLARERLVMDLLAAFARADIQVLVVKGADLAYSVYARPDVRARLDTDLLIDARDRARSVAVLDAEGWQAALHVTGDVVTYQQSFTSRARPAVVIDLHWRLNNPQRFGGVFSFEDLWRERVARPRLGPSAWGLARGHALIVACVHRVAHHFDAPRFLWIYDIHLLVETMTSEDWPAFAREVRRRDVVAACRVGLDHAIRLCGSRVPAEVLDALRPTGDDDDVAAFRRVGARPLDRLLSDLRGLPSWRSRSRLIWQHLAPSRAYMRQVYAPGRRAPLAWLYLLRATRGARRWLTR